VLARPAATGYDAWAYTAWGHALARLERPLYELGATTPKPLATLLALPVVPLPPERAFPLVVAVFAGVLAGALFAAAHRRAGTLAGVAAVGALVFGVRLDLILWFGHSDGITAALVVLALALGGWPRVGCLVAAGLLRPEAWLLAGIAAFLESRGRFRRPAFAAAAFVLPVLLWLGFDLVATGDALATQHWREGQVRGLGGLPVRDLVAAVWDRLTEVVHPAIVLVGAAGLVVHLVRSRPHDPLPLVTVVVWIGTLAAERSRGIELNARYFFPAAAVLALGCGLLAGTALPERLRRRLAWPAAAAALAILAVAAVTMDFNLNAREAAQRADAVDAALPALEEALACGTLATTGTRQSAVVIPQLAAAARESLHDFDVYEPDGRYAAVLRFDAYRFESGRKAQGLRRQAERALLPPWPTRETALGSLALSPAC
jgi:hypothetical protein